MTGYSLDSPRASSSGESLDALKARTTPMDITNPFVTPHASCELAFLATTINIEHRYNEVHMHFTSDNVTPGTQLWRTADASTITLDTLPHLDTTLSLIDDRNLALIDQALIELAVHQGRYHPRHSLAVTYA